MKGAISAENKFTEPSQLLKVEVRQPFVDNRQGLKHRKHLGCLLDLKEIGWARTVQVEIHEKKRVKTLCFSTLQKTSDGLRD